MDILGDTLGDIVIQVRQNDGKLRPVRTEIRFLSLLVIGLDLVGTNDFPEAAPSSLHITEAFEDVRKERVSSGRGDGQRVTVLNERAVRHSPGGVDFHPVVEDIDMDFAAVHE